MISLHFRRSPSVKMAASADCLQAGLNNLSKARYLFVAKLDKANKLIVSPKPFYESPEMHDE
jgi:hypothetical protein